jgi:predicted Zn-dependent protease
MAKVRWTALAALLAAGGILLGMLLDRRLQTPLGRTLAPLFGLTGRTTQELDRALSHVLPLGDVDERTLGEALRARCGGAWRAETPEARYLDALIAEITAHAQRDLDYHAYVVDGPPNACALPGGTVLVTTGLLALLDTEAQLIAVLGHEVGHVESGHCFDAAKFEMLSRKLGGRTLGAIADAIYGALLASSFSKTQEEEADEYGFATLLALSYEPAAMGDAFAALGNDPSGAESAGRHALDPFRDYVLSHPPLQLRLENYRARAQRWHAGHEGERMYVGARNCRERVARSVQAYDDEWR